MSHELAIAEKVFARKACSQNSISVPFCCMHIAYKIYVHVCRSVNVVGNWHGSILLLEEKGTSISRWHSELGTKRQAPTNPIASQETSAGAVRDSFYLLYIRVHRIFSFTL